MLHFKSVQYFTNLFKSRVNNKMIKMKKEEEFDNTNLNQSFRDLHHVLLAEYEQRILEQPLSGSELITYQGGF